MISAKNANAYIKKEKEGQLVPLEQQVEQQAQQVADLRLHLEGIEMDNALTTITINREK